MPESDKTLKILLQVQSDVADLQKVVGGLDQVKGKAQEAAAAGGQLNSALAGAVGGAVVVGVTAVVSVIAQIPQRILEARQEVARWNAVIADTSQALIRQEEEWFALAQAASKFGDLAQVGRAVAQGLDDAARRMEEFRTRELGLWARFADAIAHMFTQQLGGGLSPFKDALSKAQKDSADVFREGINAGNDAIGIAKLATEEWENLLSGPVDSSIDKVKANIAQLKAAQDQLVLKRQVGTGSPPDDLLAAKAALDQHSAIDRQIQAQEGHLDQLNKKQDEQTDSVTRTRLEIESLTAKRSQDAEAIATAAGNKAYEKEIEEKKKLGILDEDAIAKAAQIGRLTHDNVLAQQQHTSASGGTAAAHRTIVDLLAEEKLLLDAIKADISNVESDPFLTVDARTVALTQLLPQAIAQLNQQIEQNKASIAGSVLDPSQLNAVQSAIQRDSAEITKLQTQLKTLSSGGQLKTSLIAWANQFGTVAHQVANTITNTIGNAINGVSSGITGLIFGTQSLGQAALQMASSFVQSLIQVGLQMVVQKVLGSTLTAATTAEQVTAGATIAAANAPAAAATSIASYGASAVIGTVAAVAAIAAIIAAIAGGFEAGGYTGDGHRSSVAGVVHRGEYVIPQSDVRRAGGPQIFDNLRLAINRPGYERGGSVGGSSSAGPSRAGGGAVHIFNFTDMKALEKAYMRSTAAKKIIIDTVNGAGGHLRS